MPAAIAVISASFCGSSVAQAAVLPFSLSIKPLLLPFLPSPLRLGAVLLLVSHNLPQHHPIPPQLPLLQLPPPDHPHPLNSLQHPAIHAPNRLTRPPYHRAPHPRPHRDTSTLLHAPRPCPRTCNSTCNSTRPAALPRTPRARAHPHPRRGAALLRGDRVDRQGAPAPDLQARARAGARPGVRSSVMPSRFGQATSRKSKSATGHRDTQDERNVFISGPR